MSKQKLLSLIFVCTSIICFSQNHKINIPFGNAYSFISDSCITANNLDSETNTATFGIITLDKSNSFSDSIQTIPILDKQLSVLYYPQFIKNHKNICLIVSNENDTNEYSLIKILKNGKIDPSFGKNGKLKISIPNVEIEKLTEIKIDNENRILLGGRTSSQKSIIIRLLHTGELDISFNSVGWLEIETEQTGIANIESISIDSNISITLEIAKQSKTGIEFNNVVFIVNSNGIVIPSLQIELSKSITKSFKKAYIFNKSIYLNQLNVITITDLNGILLKNIEIPQTLQCSEIIYNHYNQQIYIIATKGSPFKTEHESHLYTITNNFNLEEILDSKTIEDGVLFLDFDFTQNNTLQILATQVHPNKMYEYLPFLYTIKLL